jgi:hypothetical protein
MTNDLISLEDPYTEESSLPVQSTNFIEQMKTQLNAMSSDNKGRLTRELAGEGEEDFPST